MDNSHQQTQIAVKFSNLEIVKKTLIKKRNWIRILLF